MGETEQAAATEAETPEATDTDETATPAADVDDVPADTSEKAPEGDKPAEGEPAAEAKPADEAKPAEIPEADLKAAAEKYAADAVKRANQTMAAARRAERAVDTVKTENANLKKQNEVYEGFVEQIKTQPLAALGRLGFRTFKEFAAHCVATGSDRELTPEDRISALEKQLRESTEGGKKAEEDRQAQAIQRSLFKALDDHKEVYTRTSTRLGKATLWEAISAYGAKYGLKVHEVSDAAIGRLAEEVEKDLRADFGDPTIPASPAATKTGTSAAAPAATAARNGGKTLAGKASSGAPSVKEYSLDPEERRKQVSEDMRAAGEL